MSKFCISSDNKLVYCPPTAYNFKVLILISSLFLITTPWFLFLNLPYKIISLITLGFVFLIKDKFNLKILTVILLVISVLIFAVSVVRVPETKTRVDIEREWASTGKFKKVSSLFSNKYVQSFRVSEDLLFQNLDFGNYFFAGHPRERPGMVEIQKLYAVSVIFIIFGLIKIKNNLRLFLISFFVFAISLSVLLKDPSPKSSFLVLPVFAFLAATGLLSLVEDSGKWRKVVLVISLLIFCMEGVIFIGPV